MGNSRRVWLSVAILLPTLIVADLMAADRASPMKLEDVLRAAVATAKIGEARLELARSNLRYLETLNKTRIELRPSLGLFAFSAPALLAGNLGTGLLFNRRTAPGPAAMDNARFDALTADVSAENLKVRAQLEAARSYFDLLGRQQVTQLAETTLAAQRERKGELDRFLQASRITAADALAYEQDLLDLESVWLNAESERKSSAVRLAALMGMSDLSNVVTVADVNLDNLPMQAEIPGIDKLVTLAMRYRGESRFLHEKLDAIHNGSRSHRKVTVEAGNIGYSYIGNTMGLAEGSGGGVLGGNTGRGELTLNIPLRDTGERAAHDAVTSARIGVLELEISSMETSIRMELTGLRDSAASNLERVRLAKRKLELARKSAEVVRTRAENGLTSLTSAWSADQAVLFAKSAYTRAEYERKSSLYELLIVCGVEQQPKEFETSQ